MVYSTIVKIVKNVKIKKAATIMLLPVFYKSFLIAAVQFCSVALYSLAA